MGSMLDDWYGPRRAARMRRERSFAAAPTPDQVGQLSPEMRALLEARMRSALTALKAAYGTALAVASNWPEFNWKTAVAASYMP